MNELGNSCVAEMYAGNASTPLPMRRHALEARIAAAVLPQLHKGRIVVMLPSGREIDLRGGEPGIEVQLTIHRWRAMRRLMSGGAIGFARAYVAGDWSTSDLVALLELLALNSAQIARRVRGSALLRVLNRLAHLRRANTRAGSRRNIEFHYDLGNEFYSQWLDRSMLYSSAIFSSAGQSLEAAQDEKLRLILDLLAIEPGQSVLEIGCGWGTLAAAMAHEASAKVTAITLSPAQLAWAQGRIEHEGLADRVDLRLDDYRDTVGQFDRLVSIEMIEAVGAEYWPSYFDAIRNRLKPGGRAVLQAITIAEEHFEAYRKQPDFIQRFIFPGGCLPTKTAIRDGLEAAGLRLVEQHHFADSYAQTLAEWRRRFLAAWPRIEALGYDGRFKRLWEYYLCYCEAGFKARTIDVGLYVVEHR